MIDGRVPGAAQRPALHRPTASRPDRCLAGMVSRLGIVSRLRVLSLDVLSRWLVLSRLARIRTIESETDELSPSVRSRTSLRARACSTAAARAESSSGRTGLGFAESTAGAVAGSGTAGREAAATGPTAGRGAGFATS